MLSSISFLNASERVARGGAEAFLVLFNVLSAIAGSFLGEEGALAIAFFTGDFAEEGDCVLAGFGGEAMDRAGVGLAIFFEGVGTARTGFGVIVLTINDLCAFRFEENEG